MLSSTARRRLPPLHALRAFEAAARHLSFKQAAAELAVTPTAISHHVRLLEKTLGVPLFERRTRRVSLTSAGKDLYPVLRESFDAIAEAALRLRTPSARKVVTLSATVAFTARWLVPRVSAFQQANPDIDLRLHASDEPADLHAGVADAAIRYGTGNYPGLKAEKLLRDSFAPVCSPRLKLRRPEELATQTLIHFEWRYLRSNNPTWPRWLRLAGVGNIRPKANLVFTDESHAIQAAVAGQGVALLSLMLVSDEIKRGTLVQPFKPSLEGYQYWLVYRIDAQHSTSISGLRRWIRTELGLT
ncbi:transcriptional regulator GcvA [Bradyrhizobium sp. CW11]|uniref:transcriptional regulator GcvA n=1 Tax=Bradyrhizobium sp. CW11 TaxID=2782684 RepID=UPI001FF816F4|nr:transcriptional regulator GcvA [Bradyrhizobium sp. CW11]MCK1344507.1 transcriptional regulator GcvA [Bradyrhizobium sp. CW11]